MFKFLFIILCIFLSTVSNSTGQILDELKVDQTTFRIKEEPLTQIIKTSKLKKLVEDDDALKHNSHYICTANYRGFKVIWRLYKGELYIESIIKNPCNDTTHELEAKLVFSESDSYPIKATWFNGDISTQISEEKYLDDKYTYDLLVYSFTDGKLTLRGIVKKQAD